MAWRGPILTLNFTTHQNILLRRGRNMRKRAVQKPSKQHPKETDLQGRSDFISSNSIFQCMVEEVLEREIKYSYGKIKSLFQLSGFCDWKNASCSHHALHVVSGVVTVGYCGHGMLTGAGLCCCSHHNHHHFYTLNFWEQVQ